MFLFFVLFCLLVFSFVRSFVRLFVCLFVCLLICLFVYFVCLFVCLFVLLCIVVICGGGRGRWLVENVVPWIRFVLFELTHRKSHRSLKSVLTEIANQLKIGDVNRGKGLGCQESSRVPDSVLFATQRRWCDTRGTLPWFEDTVLILVHT